MNLGSVPAGDYTLTITAQSGYRVRETVVFQKDFTKETDMVVFVKDNVGSGTGDGSSYENALKPTSVVTAGATGVYNQKNTALYQAWKKVINAGVNSATIVICGDYTITDANCYVGSSSWSNADFNYQDGMNGNVSITYTSVFGGKDYRKDGACIRLEGKAQLSFPTETKTENIDFVSANRTADTTMLCGNHFGMYLGKDTTFNQPTTFTIFGGSRSNASSSGTTNVTVDIGDENAIGDIYGLSNGGNAHTGDSNIVIKSGSILGIIAGDSKIDEQNGLTGNVNITIAGGVIKNNVYGVTGGFSDTDGKVTVKVTGGTFSNWVKVMPTDGSIYSDKYAPATAVLDLSGASASVANAASSKASGFSTKKEPLVVFIKDGGTGDGTSAESPMGDIATSANYANGNVNALMNTALYRAWEKCIAAGGGTIVVCGEYTIDDSMCYMETGWTNADMKYLGALNPDITITYTSVYKNNDYRLVGAQFTLTQHSHLMFPTATVTENINFSNESRSSDRNISDLGGSCCDLYLGSDTRFINNAANFRIIGGSRSNASGAGDTNITLNIGDGEYNCVGSIYGLSDGTYSHAGNATINIISGTVLGNVVGDGYTIGTSGDVEINISGGSVKGSVYGASIGFTDTDGSVYVNISGGDFSDCDAIAVADGIASGYNAPAYAELDLNGLDEATRNRVVAIADDSFTFDMPLVIFIADGGTGDGRTPDAPLARGTGSATYANAPLYRAWEEIIASGKDATIVICGTYTLKETDYYRSVGANTEMDIIMDGFVRYPDITITYTSVYGGVDYRETANAKLAYQGLAALTLPTGSVFNNITVKAGECGARNTYLAAGFNPLTLGQGTNFEPNSSGKYPIVLGGHRNYGSIVAVTDPANIVVDIGDGNTIGDVYGLLAFLNKSHPGDSNITIKSGTVGSVYGDTVNPNGSYGMIGKVSISITGGTIKGKVVATNVGYDSADTTRAASVVITGGDFSKAAGIVSITSGRSLNGPNSSFVIDCSNGSYTTYTQVKKVAGSLTVLAPAAQTATNTTTGTQYLTLADALAAATSGQTVKLTDNVTDTTVTVPRGVTLNLSNYTLTAKFVVGLEGSKIVGNSGSKLVVPEGNLKMSEDAYSVVSGENTYYFLPVWDNNSNCYIISNFMMDTTAGGQTITSNAIGFRFNCLSTSTVMGLLTDDGCSNNGMSIVLQLRWNVGNKKAVQNFYYSDEQVQVVAAGGSYVFTLTNYSQLGINGAEVEVQPMVVTDSGVTLFGDTWVNGAVG